MGTDTKLVERMKVVHKTVDKPTIFAYTHYRS
jgi:hypothetical protein